MDLIKGKWNVESIRLCFPNYSPPRGTIQVTIDGIAICKVNHNAAADIETTEAAGLFFAEAGSVASNTGLTPKQLLQQRNDLLKALNNLMDKCNIMPNSKCKEHENPFGEAFALVNRINNQLTIEL